MLVRCHFENARRNATYLDVGVPCPVPRLEHASAERRQTDRECDSESNESEDDENEPPVDGLSVDNVGARGCGRFRRPLCRFGLLLVHLFLDLLIMVHSGDGSHGVGTEGKDA